MLNKLTRSGGGGGCWWRTGGGGWRWIRDDWWRNTGERGRKMRAQWQAVTLLHSLVNVYLSCVNLATDKHTHTHSVPWPLRAPSPPEVCVECVRVLTPMFWSKVFNTAAHWPCCCHSNDSLQQVFCSQCFKSYFKRSSRSLLRSSSQLVTGWSWILKLRSLV